MGIQSFMSKRPARKKQRTQHARHGRATAGPTRCAAAGNGLNRAELYSRAGDSGSAIKFPRVLGIECVGLVVAAPKSKQFRPGQTVMAMMNGMGRSYDGSYAEYSLVPESSCFLVEKPTAMSWKKFASLPEMFQTTNGSLTAGLECVPGETLLIRGGTSSIGQCAIVLAKQMGLKVIATSRSKAKLAMLTKQGADHTVVDNGNIAKGVRQLCPSGVDRVLELVGTHTLRDSMLATRPKGVVCMTGCLGSWELAAQPDMWGFIPSTVRLTTYGGGAEDVTQKELQVFVERVAKGELDVPVDPSDFELADLVAAHQYMEANKARGKVVCVIDPNPHGGDK
eukprot:g3211.t1